jgi:hypothetical protein
VSRRRSATPVGDAVLALELTLAVASASSVPDVTFATFEIVD